MLKCVSYTRLLEYFYRYLTVFCVVIYISAFLFSFSSTVKAEYSYALNGTLQNSTLHCDNNGVYVISFSSNNLEINYISNTTNKHIIKITGEIKSVVTDNGIIYAISRRGTTLYLNRYTVNTDTLDIFQIDTTSINSNYKFAVSGNKLYFAENENYNNITCYSIYGQKLYSFYVDGAIDYKVYNNQLYVFTTNKIYTVNTADNYSPQAIFSTVSLEPNMYLCNNALFDYSGYIINLQNEKIISTQIERKGINCGFINGYYCKYSFGTIYGYNENGDKYTLYNVNAGDTAQMCSFDNKLYILSENQELFIIEQNELTFPQVNNNNLNNNNNIPHSTQPNNKNPQQSNNTNNKTFAINSYYVDRNKNIIWNIPNSTTISTFKSNLTYDGYLLEFYNKNNVNVKNGKIGTGYVMSVKNNNIEQTRYSMSVIGDLTGEGSANRSDVRLLSAYLMNSLTLTDEQYAASDCNGDGIINGVDILKIARNNL